MKITYTKIFVVLIFIAILFVPYFTANAQDSGLVPCGSGLGDLCTACDFFELVDNVKNFLMFNIVPPVGVLFVVIAGFFILTAGAKPANLGRGKKILTDLVWGILIIFGAWMITNTILKILSSGTDVSDNWYKIDCRVEGIGVGGDGGPGGSTTPIPTIGLPPSGDAQSLAQQILAKSGIKLATSHPSGVNDNATARQNIADVAAGKSAARSCYPNAPCGTTSIATKLLQGILIIAGRFSSINISEIAGGSHSRGSLHYSGRAVDINFANGQHLTCGAAQVSAVMQACRDAGGRANDESCSANHVHCSF